MTHSEQINEIATALAKAQGQFEAVTKGNRAKIEMKSGGEYSYQYADLADIVIMGSKILSSCGIAVCQSTSMEVAAVSLTTLIMHTSGQWIENTITGGIDEGGGKSWIKALGSAITYFRRYEYGSMLGIVTEKDDDAAAADTASKAPPAKPKSGQTQQEIYARINQRINALEKAEKLTKESAVAYRKELNAAWRGGTGNTFDMEQIGKRLEGPAPKAPIDEAKVSPDLTKGAEPEMF
jgi:hypothetical protein